MHRIPTVVSLDATPQQYDELGEYYAHGVSAAPVERIKKWANQRCFDRARHLVTWSDWAKRGLVDGHGVSPDKVSVIAPGVDLEMWARPTDAATRSDGPVRVLFVGGNLTRKGGDLLLTAASHLREDPAVCDFEVHLVTGSEVTPTDGVVVHHGLGPNSPELIEQYHLADVFCLPTLGDCLPMVLAEAGAAGLPLISTDVGAISEVVTPQTGRLIPPDDLDALTAALRELLGDPATREACGRQAHDLVARGHDARRNAEHLLDTLRRHA